MGKQKIRARPAPRGRMTTKRDRFNELVSAGFNECVLRSLVTGFSVASNKRHNPLTEMTTKQLASLAQRICCLIGEITTVNDKVARASGRPVSEVPGARLPVDLALYAAWLFAIVNSPIEHRASDHQLTKLLLLAAAQKFTNRPCYAALSDLLTEASGEDVSPESLSQLAKDHELQIREMQVNLSNILAPFLPGSTT